MSEEEVKVREELESEIERDLEEEIKDGIYHLALRLHRLYQHQRGRQVMTEEEEKKKKKKNMVYVSEVNINIRMEGRTKIEIKETRQDASRVEKNAKAFDVGNKFEWTKSLRGGGPKKKLHGGDNKVLRLGWKC